MTLSLLARTLSYCNDVWLWIRNLCTQNLFFKPFLELLHTIINVNGIFEMYPPKSGSLPKNLGVWTGIWEFWFMIWDFLFWEIQFRSQKRWSENRSFPFADRHHWWLGIQLRTKLSIDISTHKTKIHSVHPNFCHFVFEIKCNDGKVVDHRMFSGYMYNNLIISRLGTDMSGFTRRYHCESTQSTQWAAVDQK